MGGGARVLVRQPKTAVFLWKSPKPGGSKSVKWLLRVLKGGRTKMLMSAKNNKHPIIIYAIKKADILNQNVFFLLETTYLHKSLKGLNSSLAQSVGELLPGVKCPPEWLLREQNFGQLWFRSHYFCSRYARKSIKGSIDVDFVHLVFN